MSFLFNADVEYFYFGFIHLAISVIFNNSATAALTTVTDLSPSNNFETFEYEITRETPSQGFLNLSFPLFYELGICHF